MDKHLQSLLSHVAGSQAAVSQPGHAVMAPWLFRFTVEFLNTVSVAKRFLLGFSWRLRCLWRTTANRRIVQASDGLTCRTGTKVIQTQVLRFFSLKKNLGTCIQVLQLMISCTVCWKPRLQYWK